MLGKSGPSEVREQLGQVRPLEESCHAMHAVGTPIENAITSGDDTNPDLRAGCPVNLHNFILHQPVSNRLQRRGTSDQIPIQTATSPSVTNRPTLKWSPTL
jgi:hypothetical protein